MYAVVTGAKFGNIFVTYLFILIYSVLNSVYSAHLR